MRTLTKYLLREFIGPFFISLGAFSVIILVVRIFDEIRMIMDHRPPFAITVQYFFYQLPFLILQITPLAVLMAVLFALNRLSRNGELIALRAGGIGLFQTARPFLTAAAAVFVGIFLFNEAVVPKTQEKARYLKWVKIEKKEPPRKIHRRQAAFRGEGGRMYYLGEVWGDRNEAREVLILEFSAPLQLHSRLDAKKARWKEGRWTFENAMLRLFDENGSVLSARSFETLELVLPEKPSDFLEKQREPREMGFLELWVYLQKLRRSGLDDRKEAVEWHLKIAFPFSSVILALLGLAWGWRHQRGGSIAASFGICLLVAFAYVGLLEVGHALGDSGVLPPFAVWLPNLLFGAGGFTLLRRADR